MSGTSPTPGKRDYLLPPGCEDLTDVLKSPLPESPPSFSAKVKVNGKITTPEVHVIGKQGEHLGIMAIADALKLAKSGSIDLIEIAPTTKPPVCRLVDFGKFRYEQSKQKKKN